jgi:predicted RNA polymerase sigma factor
MEIRWKPRRRSSRSSSKGKPVDLDNKQKRLYDKYLARPSNSGLQLAIV